MPRKHDEDPAPDDNGNSEKPDGQPDMSEADAALLAATIQKIFGIGGKLSRRMGKKGKDEQLEYVFIWGLVRLDAPKK